MIKAIFLDRDGVINIEKDYLYKIEEFEFIKGVFSSLKYLQNLDYKLFIITNQSGIGRGYYTKDDFEKLSFWMKEELKKENITISQIEYCPHTPKDECTCRKPKIGMIKNILKNHDIDLNNSWLIGDKDSDIRCAINAKIKNTIQVKSGHSFEEKDSKANFVCASIAHIKDIIKK